MGGTRPADRPASAGRWGRQASTDHSHEDGEGAVDAVLFTVQDPRTARHRRVPTAHDQRQRQKTAKHERSGHAPFALVRHVGRRSGRAYATPLVVARVAGGFVVELTYGPDVDWYRNITAAG